MKNSWLIVLSFSILLFSGCLTTDKNKNKSDKNIETHIADLNGDMMPETIEIENRFQTDGNSVIKIIKGKKDKKAEPKICTFTVPGYFKRVEFVDLNEDGFKQVAIYYDTEDNHINLGIYKIKNDRAIKIFSASSACDIETDFSSLLARVKVGKGKDGTDDCSSGTGGYWDVWVYTGEKFIKEK